MEIAEFKRRQVEGIVQVRSQALYEGGKRRIDQDRIEELAEQRWGAMATASEFDTKLRHLC